MSGSSQSGGVLLSETEVVNRQARLSCIEFYKTPSCIFCEPALLILNAILDDYDLKNIEVCEIILDDERLTEGSGISSVPEIRICNIRISGFRSDLQELIQSAILQAVA